MYAHLLRTLLRDRCHVAQLQQSSRRAHAESSRDCASGEFIPCQRFCISRPRAASHHLRAAHIYVLNFLQLHWDEEGEPEDTVDGMLGRALT